LSFQQVHGSPTRKPKKKPVEEVKVVEAPKAKRKPNNTNASKAIEQEVRISTAIMLLKKGHADLATSLSISMQSASRFVLSCSIR
jgi:hypothetical protein